MKELEIRKIKIKKVWIIFIRYSMLDKMWRDKKFIKYKNI